MTAVSHRFSRIAILGLLAAVAFLSVGHSSDGVSAHGKELSITTSSFVPDPEDPLKRLYRIHVIYASDLDPVEDASVVMNAAQVNSERATGPIEMTEVEGESGLYVGELKFTRFGTWQVQIDVKANLGVGSGIVSFEESVRPGNLSEAEQAALEIEGERVRRLQVFFKFGLWPDMVNILVRITHSLSAVGYFGIVGLALTMAWFGVPTRMRATWERVRSSFLIVAALSLTGILGTGLYSMAYDAPITAPGIYDLDGLLAIPYGEWYFAAFLLKPVAWLGLVFLALRVYFVVVRHEALAPSPVRGSSLLIAGGADNAPERLQEPVPGLRRLTYLTIAVGVALVADLAVVIYLHYLSHLGVFLPS